MAIDPNIYAQFIQSRERPRLATVGEIEEQKALREDRAMQRKLQLDALRLRQQEAEAKLANDAAIAEAFQQGTGPDGIPRRKAVLGRLYQTNPTAAQAVETWFTEQATRQAALDKTEREGETEFMRRLAAANSPGAIAMLRTKGSDKYRDVLDWYGPAPDPTKQEYLRRAIGEADAYNKDVDAIRSRETQDAASVLELLAIARDQEHVDRAKERAALLGVDDEIEGMGLGWQFSPELSARAADLVRGVKGRDEQANIAADNQNAAAQLELGRGNLDIARGNLAVAQGNLAVRQQEANKPAAAAGSKGGRGVTSGDANRLADFSTSLDDLKVLRKEVTGDGKTGPGAWAQAIVPPQLDPFGWTAAAKSRQAVIDRVKQVIGKALEGGVLRKEDEYKYEKILPTIKDPEAVVTNKLNGLEQAIQQRRETLLSSLEDAGYDVSRYVARRSAPENDPMGIR